jgi:hypothetical protein
LLWPTPHLEEFHAISYWAAAATVVLLSSLQATVISGPDHRPHRPDPDDQPDRPVRAAELRQQPPNRAGIECGGADNLTLAPDAAGNLVGTLIGNDIISCGTTIGLFLYLPIYTNEND